MERGNPTQKERSVLIFENEGKQKKGKWISFIRLNFWEANTNKKNGKNEENEERKWDIFLFGTDLGFGGKYIYVRKKFWEGLGRKAQEQKKSNCNRVCLGMFLVILGILTHIRFLCMFVFEYLIYC